jgi:hypothetical protein
MSKPMTFSRGLMWRKSAQRTDLSTVSKRSSAAVYRYKTRKLAKPVDLGPQTGFEAPEPAS